ncbi:MAG: peptidase M13 [Burkholderiales bacterium PBB2]|nr:MAG: peptidase M13 [Burkholderiales bacterium PBB2]
MKLPRLTLLALLLQLGSLSHAADATLGLDLHGFDTQVRVQDDLFRAANGNWLKTTEIPADKASFGSFAVLRDLSDQQVRAIVEELARQPQAAGSVEHKLATFYTAFLDTAAIDQAGLAPLQPLLADIDALKSPRELAQWLGRMQGHLSTPVELSVGPDFKNPSLNLAAASQGGLGLPGRDYYLKQEPRMLKARAAYLQYLQTLAQLAGEAQPARAAERVLALETEIAKAHWDPVANRDPVKAYNPMSPAELARKAPGFDWAAFLEAARLGQIDRLVVAQPSMAIALARLHAKRPLADWKLYAKLHLLDAHASTLPQAFRDARFAFRGKALSGASQEQARWQQGMAQVNAALGDALGKLYVARHFPAGHKARMQELVANLMGAFGDSLDALSWMSPQTKLQARDKLSKFTVKIGYPDQWRDFSALEVRAGDALGNRLRSADFEWQVLAAKAGRPVDRKEWGINPQLVNAFYDPTTNEILFPAAILQPPFFDATADDAVNYGAIGAVIGHEISHGFDDQGSQFDGDGRLRNWWTPADRKAFEAVAAKLVAQFNGYEAIQGKHVNGQLTLGENIADLSGLQVAFKAYQRSLGGTPSPVIGGFSGEQRFFLGWSQAWRSKSREEATLMQVTMDPHSPAEFRANGAAVNHDGFHQAFGTKSGDKMFKGSSERIRIW